MKEMIERRPTLAAYFVIAMLPLLFLSCEKKEDSLGLDLQPDEQFLNVVSFDGLAISSSTILGDSARTNELTRAIIGEIIHPEFGTHRSTLYTQVRLSALGADFGNQEFVVVDSLVLTLEYLEDVDRYGPEGEPMLLSVKRIDGTDESNRLDLDSLYYSNYSTAVLPEELTFAQDPVFFDTENDVVIAGDTLDPQLRIRLKNELGQELVNESYSEEGTFDDIDDFLAYFAGFQIEATALGSTGGIASFDLLSSASGMTLYYHNDEDTLSFDFTINSNAQRYLAFEQDYTGTPVADHLADPSLGSQTTYLQAMGGVKVEVDISALPSLLDTMTGAFNRVEMVVPVADPAMNDAYAFPERIFAVFEDEDGDLTSIPDLFEGEAHSDGFYDEDNGEYRVNMTRFAQQIVTGVEQAESVILLPTANAVTPNFVKLVGSEGDMERIKLVITYTQFE